MKERIRVDPQQQGMNDAFAQALSSLDASALPPGRELEQPPSKKGRVVLQRETAHRGGKTVIVVREFEPAISTAEIESLGKLLRRHCGTGGTVRDRQIEIQGEMTAKIREFLTAEGFRVAGEK